MIHFFEEDVTFVPRNKLRLRKWITQVIQSFQCKPGEINFIFCTDEYLHRVNVDYLAHDYYTDIITFDQSEQDDKVEGDIYISIDRVRDNATTLGVPFESELHRVLIHGILHLLGHDDHSDEDRQIMRAAENTALETLKTLAS